ncbi:hypothetical protein [Streptomyces sp. NPDC047928]|uniref:hypothetical protein n=1 Tax=unclassified Streptomyces TaxID=2593676 RepID=UPI0037202AFF
MDNSHPPGAFVAHTGTDVYGPGKVLGVEGDWRRVRFVHFVASVRACDLRAASTAEAAEIEFWLDRQRRRYGGRW